MFVKLVCRDYMQFNSFLSEAACAVGRMEPGTSRHSVNQYMFTTSNLEAEQESRAFWGLLV